MVWSFLLAAVLSAQNFVEVKPSPQQLSWQDLEIGVLIHFGPNTFMDREWGDGTADPSVFNPTALDTEQWVLAAKSAGAKYLIMVAKHHDGFCLWPTRRSKYSVAASPWKGGKGDVVREVAAACRKHGLRFGVYLSPWDRHEPSYSDSKTYDNYYSGQISELANRYGELTEWWLDGAGSEGHVYDFERYIRTLRTYQPNAMIFSDLGLLPWADIRWVGNEDGAAFEENWNVVDAYRVLRWRPAECDTPLRERHWFWHPNDEQSLKPVSKLLDIYHKSVGRGAQLVLGLAPDNRGLMPDSDVARLKEFGDTIRRLYGSDEKAEIWQAPKPQAELVLDFSSPKSVDRALTMEDLTGGQHVRRYEIQTWTGSEWRTLVSGTTIGHKKIDLFPRTTVQRVRLVVRAALGAPQIRQFHVLEGR